MQVGIGLFSADRVIIHDSIVYHENGFLIIVLRVLTFGIGRGGGDAGKGEWGDDFGWYSWLRSAFDSAFRGCEMMCDTVSLVSRADLCSFFLVCERIIYGVGK